MQPHRVCGWGLQAVLLASCTLAACDSRPVLEPTFATLSLVSGDQQTAGAGFNLAEPLVVRLQDQDGQPIEGEDVLFSVLGTAGGTVIPGVATSGSDGTAATTLRLGSLTGTYTVRARFHDLPAVTFTATAVAAPPASLAISSGDAQSAPVSSTLPIPIRVRVTDPFGNPNAGVTVGFLVVSGGGSLDFDSAQTDLNGYAGVTWTLGPSTGTQQAVAFAQGVTPVTFTATAQ